MATRLELLEPVRERFPGKVGPGTRDLHQGELQRQTRIAALSHVLDGDRQQVDEADDGRLAELVGLRTEPLARLVRHRERVRHLAHVLHQHEVAQMLEQVDDQPAQVLSLLRQLLDERERPGRVAVDDQVAEAEQRLLFDRSQQLQDGLNGDLVLGR